MTLTDAELSLKVHMEVCPDLYADYATDLGRAMEAALKVAWNVDVQAPDSDPMCRVKLLLRRPSTPVVAFGSTLARALCLAALRASGVEVEDDEEGA